ncbi:MULTISPECIES: twin-arginine translocase TatA/TatE family subunit [Streptomyces]|uniref:Sec-independent protein translocase protein TatA n=1 Tax=Streptomyces smyrnaeus TaxID=1387713 RepID=A0ABS3XR60_9ACTN|nr:MULTISPECIES: twin-arginine translocase TatA/TatE family subunit [Streptomyces]MBO8197783.1 twin-arginine translocase TatA/TatE family subunit [Streptomyces smyrnaeus]MBQ1122241.1 twin-arginine translocase TatA/TatE family subunit [Streptomyces sp. B15]
MFGLSELALLLIVVLVVVGAKKLPELARSAGKAARILKSEKKALKDDTRQHDAAGDRERHGAARVVPGEAVERDTTPHERP